MNAYLVFWENSGGVIQSKIYSDREDLSEREWIILAAKGEEYDDDEIQSIMDDGYNLYAVIRGPVQFVY